MGQLAREGASCVSFNIRKAARAVTQLYDERMRPFGLRSTQLSILGRTLVLEPVTVTRLAEATGTDRTAMSGARAIMAQNRAAFAAGGTLLVLAAVAWAALLFQAQTPMAASGWLEAATFLTAWGIMMAAMMLPSATPMISLYSALQRNPSSNSLPGISTALFALVYLAVWVAFGVPVYIASVIVDSRVDLGDTLPYALAVVLVAAGVYQLTPLKRACLRVCRSPLGFLLARTRTGLTGTFRLALEHAAYCVGCCWALMVVLVAAGAMSLHWVLLISAVVFIEKLLPGGEWTARIVGVGLVLLGLAVAVNPDLAMALKPSMAM
jgi:predicted metal-binding membrane protein